MTSHLDAADRVRHLVSELGRVIRGKEDRIELLVLALVSAGHVLIEDIPGVGKTTLVRALATAVDGSFRRIQFTPDLLPTDITGVNVFRQEDATFLFKAGPIFANVVLADEINRASPRTQSALLEAMSEGQVTLDGESHALPAPFMVVATQNPIEYHGTYPLPEAQLDRFMVQLDLGYPPEEEERTLVLERHREDPVDALAPVATLAEVEVLRRAADAVRLEDSVADYLFAVVRATREHPHLSLGVSPRGALLFARVVRARALARDRPFVLPDDVKALAAPVLAHRIQLDTKAKYEGMSRAEVIRDIVETVPLPR